MTGPALDALEAAYAELRGRYGEAIVAETSGAGDLAEAFRDARRRYAELAAGVRAADDEERRALESMRASVEWMDDEAPGGSAQAASADDPAHLRARTAAAFGAAASAIRIGEETVDRLTALARLSAIDDADARRTIFLALEPVWRAIDGDGEGNSPYRRLLVESAARWRARGSPVDAAAAGLGLTGPELELALRRLLDAFRRALGRPGIEPWDYLHAVGAAHRLIDPLLTTERMLEINAAHLASLGADAAALGIRYDVEPRAGRPAVPVAFTLAIDVAGRTADGDWRAATPWVFASYAEGALGNLVELLHESGHALHYAAIRTRPAFFEPLAADGGFVEGIADVLGWDADEPAFQARHLGVAAAERDAMLSRYGWVMLDVCWTLLEIELHRRPDRRPNEVWAEITSEGLGIVPHPEWSWWAMRGQLLSPGYMANYALAALAAAAIRRRVREVRGDWLGGDRGWYAFLSKSLLRYGAERPSGAVLAAFLGDPLTADAVLEDLARC